MTRSIKLGRKAVDVTWNWIDRVIEHVDPIRAAKRLQARVGHSVVSGAQSGYNGASNARKSLSGWSPVASDADGDTLGGLEELRARSRDLNRNSPIAGGAIATSVTHVVGSGLSLQSQIDTEILGISEEDASIWQADTERDYRLWSESVDCDVTRHQNIYGLQQLAWRSLLESGDILVALPSIPRPMRPISLAIQLIEADRICNRDRQPDSANLVAGVELDEFGAPVAFHVCNSYPTNRRGAAARRKLAWTRVTAYGSKTGRRNALHLYERLRPGQTRGVPMLAPVIEPLKQLERYTEAELMAAVVSGLFTVFIESEGGANMTPSALAPGGQVPGADSDSAWNASLGNGLVVELGKGEKINTANPGRPNAQFDPFVTSIVRQIAMRLEIPFEVLMKHYLSSYSAARAAMQDAWRFFRGRRDWFATHFCQPIYEAYLTEAIAAGRIWAPGFFTDPLIRKAWCGAVWVGDGPGSIDPLKEVLGAKERMAANISTLSQESILHDGGDWRAKLRQRARERAYMLELGLPTGEENPPQADPGKPAQDDAEEVTPAPKPAENAIARAYDDALSVD